MRLIDEVAEKIEQLYERIAFTPEFRSLVEQWMTAQIDKLAEAAQAEMNRLKQQKDKLEREQVKLLQAHYADAIPLHLLKEEQERIGKSLKNITSQIDSYQAEHAETAKNLSYAFELLDDCGKTYKLADDFARRCLNQALFKKIRVHDDLTLDVDYAEPFDTLLDPNIFMIKCEFEKNIRSKRDGQPKTTAHHSLLDFVGDKNTKTSSNFFTTGLSMDFLAQLVILYALRYRAQKQKITLNPGAFGSSVTLALVMILDILFLAYRCVLSAKLLNFMNKYRQLLVFTSINNGVKAI